jgi:hypothetical protein
VQARAVPEAGLQDRRAREYQIELAHPSGRSRYLFGGHPTTKPPEDEQVEPPPPEEPPIEEPPEVVDPPPPDLLQTDEPPIDFSGRSGVQRTPRRSPAAPKLALLREPKGRLPQPHGSAL